MRLLQLKFISQVYNNIQLRNTLKMQYKHRLLLVLLYNGLTRTREGRATLRGANALAEAMMHTIRTIRNCMVIVYMSNLAPEGRKNQHKSACSSKVPRLFKMRITALMRNRTKAPKFSTETILLVLLPISVTLLPSKQH